MAWDWRNIQYFQPKEFDSPDAPGSGMNMDQAFVLLLDELRHRCGFPIKVNSGYRTPAHNAKVGGVHSSSHERGLAADLAAINGVVRFRIVREALAIGITRIGFARTFIHVDIDDTLPNPMTWFYPT